MKKIKKAMPFILLTLITLLIVNVSVYLNLIIQTLIVSTFNTNTDFIITFAHYFGSISIVIATLLFCKFSKSSKDALKPLKSDITGTEYHIKQSLLGLGLGMALNGICVSGALLTQSVTLTLGYSNILMLLMIFLAVFIQSSSEEVLCRIFLFNKLNKIYGIKCAIIGNSLIFSLLHITNSGVTITALLNVALAGLLISLLLYYTKSIWSTFTFHTAWNYTQNIIFGLSNSGYASQYSLFRIENESTFQNFFYNNEFGIEGTYFALLILALVCIIIYKKIRKGEKI